MAVRRDSAEFVELPNWGLFNKSRVSRIIFLERDNKFRISITCESDNSTWLDFDTTEARAEYFQKIKDAFGVV